MSRYVVFDVETPNYANDRMSAIGLAVVEDGEITRTFYSLVNPEARFDSFNISLTKITPYMVANQPTFPVLWELLEPLMDRGVLVAHNAPFDMSVLGKCLRDYGIDWKPFPTYLCTCQVGRRFLPQLPSHRLNVMASYYRLPLDHHNAKSDALACAGLLLNYLKSGVDLSGFLRTYDIRQLRTISDPEPDTNPDPEFKEEQL